MKAAKLKSKLVPGFRWRATDSTVGLDAEIIKKMFKLSVWARGEILRRFASKLPCGEQRDELVQAIRGGDFARARELAMHIAHTLPQKLGSAVGVAGRKKQARFRGDQQAPKYLAWQRVADELRARHPDHSVTRIAELVAGKCGVKSAQTIRRHIDIKPAKTVSRP
jgi:hypothetical protein